MITALLTPLLGGLIFFAQLPATTNYKLNSYGFGSGGGANVGTSTYKLEGISGEVSGQTTATSNYKVKPGFVETQQANVPTVTLSNPANYYDKLKFVIGQEGNPSDAKYALQISTTSDFSSGNNYVKSDLTIGPTLVLADYQTYTAFGGASGATIIGLTPATTYYIRVKATQTTSDAGVLGKFNESPYGPSSSAATVGPSISFDIDIAAIDTETSPAYSVAMGTLLAGTVVTATDKVWYDFSTNANSGGNIYLYSQNGGLTSASASHTITSATTDLSSAGTGFGIQSASATQASGGPISAVSPYDGTSQNVGIINSTIREIYTSSNPIVDGRTSYFIKAKSAATTPSATDYSEIITTIVAGNF